MTDFEDLKGNTFYNTPVQQEIGETVLLMTQLLADGYFMGSLGGQGQTLIADQGLGKSTILRMVGRAAYLMDSNLIAVYADLGRNVFNTTPLMHFVARTVESQLCEQDGDAAKSTLGDKERHGDAEKANHLIDTGSNDPDTIFRNIVAALRRHKKRLLLLVDDFDQHYKREPSEVALATLAGLTSVVRDITGSVAAILTGSSSYMEELVCADRRPEVKYLQEHYPLLAKGLDMNTAKFRLVEIRTTDSTNVEPMMRAVEDYIPQEVFDAKRDSEPQLKEQVARAVLLTAGPNVRHAIETVKRLSNNPNDTPTWFQIIALAGPVGRPEVPISPDFTGVHDLVEDAHHRMFQKNSELRSAAGIHLDDSLEEMIEKMAVIPWPDGVGEDKSIRFRGLETAEMRELCDQYQWYGGERMMGDFRRLHPILTRHHFLLFRDGKYFPRCMLSVLKAADHVSVIPEDEKTRQAMVRFRGKPAEVAWQLQSREERREAVARAIREAERWRIFWWDTCFMFASALTSTLLVLGWVVVEDTVRRKLRQWLEIES